MELAFIAIFVLFIIIKGRSFRISTLRPMVTEDSICTLDTNQISQMVDYEILVKIWP
jgi:hypothetical protein